MFPPIFREAEKRPFNQYALQRIRAELSAQGSMVGFHPEGKRNKDPDPYSFLPAKRGVGEVIHHTPEAKVIPIYLQGMRNQVFGEIIANWFSPQSNPIHVHFGAPTTFDDPQQSSSTPELHQEISEACMDQIRALAEAHRSQFEP